MKCYFYMPQYALVHILCAASALRMSNDLLNAFSGLKMSKVEREMPAIPIQS